MFSDSEIVDAPASSELVVQRKSHSKSFVWEHFEKLDIRKAKCTYCKCEIQTKYGSTSGLSRHLKSKHPNINIHINIKTEESEPTTSVSYLDKNSEKSKDLTNAIARMMALDLQPYSIVEDVGFRSLLKVAEPRYKIPSRSTFSREMIPQMYEDLKRQIDDQIYSNIKEDTVLSFTTDGWSSRAVESYMSLTIHYLSNDFNLCHHMLNLERLKKSHTAEYIKDILLKCLTSWKFYDANKTLIFVTDNGRNIVKSIEMNKTWTQIPCFAHCIQLVVKTTLKKFPSYKIIDKKCRDIVGFFKRSTSAKEKFIEIQLAMNQNETPLQLLQEVDTRWNSAYIMFQRMNILRKPLTVLLCDNDMPQNLTNDEWKFTETLISLLEPIKEVTEIMCGENYPTLSQYLPMYIGLTNIFQEYVPQTTLAKEICQQLCKELKVRFEKIIISEQIMMSMLLDPRYKDRLLETQESKNEAINCLKKKIVCKEGGEDDNIEYESRYDDKGEPKSKLFKFFETKLGKPESQKKCTGGTFIKNKNKEMNTYFEEDLESISTDIVDWWKKNSARLPLLSDTTKKYIAIPATQATSERLFSTAGNIVTANRTKLLSENVEKLVFLHENLK